MNSMISLSTSKIVELIKNAKHRVFYFSPGLHEEIANAILYSSISFDNDSCHVAIDPTPDVCRFGYGEISAIEKLLDSGIKISKIEGIRLGILLIDNQAYLFTPTPLLIEAEEDHPIFNSITISFDQAKSLISSLLPKTNLLEQDEQEQKYTTHSVIQKSSITPYDPRDLAVAKQDLAERPPKKFDTERMVRVYNSYIQFVELKFTGLQFARHTIKIPTKLFSVSKNSEVNDRLKATYKLINENSKISCKEIENKIASLRKVYLRPLGSRLGSLILQNNKTVFLEEIEKIRSDLDHFSKSIKKELQDEIHRTKKELVKLLLPGVMKNPPDELKGGIALKLTKDIATNYILDELEKMFPSDAEKYVDNIKLFCDFKDVTYEMLNDKEFQENVQRLFPYANLPKLYEDYEAVQLSLF